ncbi:MAG: non-canonical purine NTP diphosphatase [Bacteroidales bacterium]|nr:non-canonical purine NTP diphosphatase [Bacteroidales bacterium]
MEIVFATNNQHKLKEIREIIGNMFTVRSLEDIGCREDIPEDAETLEENASFKARFIYDKYGYDCFADDTGLEIYALEGRPGVKSARYAGEDCISENNIRKVLKELEDVSDRGARFRTVISLIRNGQESLFEGSVEGIILREKQGEGGFGYDPIFLPKGHTQSFASMGPDKKNGISHRGRAMQKLIAFLKHAPSLP